jgi:hypothetical protein
MKKYSKTTAAWAKRWRCCWRCGRRGTWPESLSIHHFVRGSFRHKNDLATTAMLCRECHEEDEHNGDSLGLLGMLALKRRWDPEHYDLARVNQLRGRAANAIT